MATTEHIKWLKDCEICNAGLCSQMKSIIVNQKLTERSAAIVLAEMVARQEGHPVYSAKQLLDRYRYYTNKDRRKKVSEIPKHKDGSASNTTTPKVSNMKPLMRPMPDLNNFQALQKSARFLAEGLRSWADGAIKPQSDQEVKAAQAIKETAADIIAQYARLDVDVKGIYETESQDRITQKERTHGLD